MYNKLEDSMNKFRLIFFLLGNSNDIDLQTVIRDVRSVQYIMWFKMFGMYLQMVKTLH